MANLLFTFALARRLEKTGITVNAVSPGSKPSKESPAPLRFFSWLLSQPSSQASENIVASTTAAESEKMTGKFLQEGQEIEAPAYAHDRETQERLWKLSEDLTELSSTKGVTPINDPHL